MTLLIIGLVLFLGMHSASIVSDDGRNRMVDRLGEGAWKGLYSLVSMVGLGLILYGYSQARLAPTVLWVPPIWMRHLVFLLMVPVFPLLFAVYLPGRIKRTTKHPMLIATKIWALSHLLVNGMLADALLFGGFLVWAVADRISLKRRTPRVVPGAPESGMNDVVAVVGGLVFYIVFLLWGHRWAIGMPLV